MWLNIDWVEFVVSQVIMCEDNTGSSTAVGWAEMIQFLIETLKSSI